MDICQRISFMEELLDGLKLKDENLEEVENVMCTIFSSLEKIPHEDLRKHIADSLRNCIPFLRVTILDNNCEIYKLVKIYNVSDSNKLTALDEPISAERLLDLIYCCNTLTIFNQAIGVENIVLEFSFCMIEKVIEAGGEIPLPILEIYQTSNDYHYKIQKAVVEMQEEYYGYDIQRDLIAFNIVIDTSRIPIYKTSPSALLSGDAYPVYHTCYGMDDIARYIPDYIKCKLASVIQVSDLSQLLHTFSDLETTLFINGLNSLLIRKVLPKSGRS